MRTSLTAFALALTAASLLVAMTASPASAAVCADYPNQKAAQEAHDTLDGDGDGIYCEALPCPCSDEANDVNGGGGGGTTEAPNTKAKKTYVYFGRVTQVVDGDTLKVKIKKKVKTVRLLGIDTPEANKPNVAQECGSKEATSAAMKWSFGKALDNDGDGLYDHGRKGRQVRLRTDNTQTKTDQYGRLLAYVSRGSSDLGKKQVAKGWAELFVFESNPFKRLASYQAAFDSAKAANLGVWSLCGGDFHSQQ